MTYRESRISTPLAAQLGDYFALSISLILQHPHSALSDLHLLSIKDHQRLLQWNEPLPEPRSECVHQVITSLLHWPRFPCLAVLLVRLRCVCHGNPNDLNGGGYCLCYFRGRTQSHDAQWRLSTHGYSCILDSFSFWPSGCRESIVGGNTRAPGRTYVYIPHQTMG